MTQEEYDDLKKAGRNQRSINVDVLQTLCTQVAKHKPVTTVWGTFTLPANSTPVKVDPYGALLPTTDADLDDLSDAVGNDACEVLLLSRPGYGSDYRVRQIREVLHSPSGNAFK